MHYGKTAGVEDKSGGNGQEQFYEIQSLFSMRLIEIYIYAFDREKENVCRKQIKNNVYSRTVIAEEIFNYELCGKCGCYNEYCKNSNIIADLFYTLFVNSFAEMII